ncbi:hypothetical protein DRH27_03835 [Candidatus Falkowbacteria bacterium]|nr:MAG: hypothetical protein DRH27_03835 [Candidatus Falkowbacteria bacterium]
MKIIKTCYYKFFCNKIVNKNLFEREKYSDRNVLELIIIPYVLGNFNPKKILDIGREDYEKFYNEFFSGRELWTIDIDPKRKKYGSPGRHIIDDAANVKNHFKTNYFDFILINGVLGWGLNQDEKIEKAFEGIYDIIKEKGLLVLGWNDFDDAKHRKPHEIKALKKFTPYFFKPLKGTEFECVNGHHKYNFYIK